MPSPLRCPSPNWVWVATSPGPEPLQDGRGRGCLQHVNINQSIYRWIHLSVYVSIHLFIYIYLICLSIFQSIDRSVSIRKLSYIIRWTTFNNYICISPPFLCSRQFPGLLSLWDKWTFTKNLRNWVPSSQIEPGLSIMARSFQCPSAPWSKESIVIQWWNLEMIAMVEWCWILPTVWWERN